MLSPSLLKYFPVLEPDSAFLKVVPTANYTSGGDTLNISPSALADPNGKGIIGYPETPPSVPPTVTSVVGMTGADLGLYAEVVPGTTLGNYKLQMFLPGGTEVSGGAYGAGILTGYFIVQVIF